MQDAALRAERSARGEQAGRPGAGRASWGAGRARSEGRPRVAKPDGRVGRARPGPAGGGARAWAQVLGSAPRTEQRRDTAHGSGVASHSLLPTHNASPRQAAPPSASRTSSALPGQGPRFRRRGAEGAPNPGARRSPERLSTSHSWGPQKIAAKADSSSRTRPAMAARSRLNAAPSATASGPRSNAAGSRRGAPRVSTARGGPGAGRGRRSPPEAPASRLPREAPSLWGTSGGHSPVTRGRVSRVAFRQPEASQQSWKSCHSQPRP